ncbi:hypothetical protein SHIRM173S_09656 [Streptomyces hirsutus]
MTALAVGGIGTGSALLVGLGMWTVAARPENRLPGPGRQFLGRWSAGRQGLQIRVSAQKPTA